MTRALLRHGASAVVVGAFAVLATATSSPSNPPPPEPTSAAAPATEQAAATAGRAQLESHMSEGEDYAEGPQAAAIARVIRDHVEPGDAVGVKVIEGSPPHIVVLVHFSDDDVEGLRDLGDERRREYIDGMIESIDAEGFSEGCSVGVGIRGRIFYGAVGVRRLGQETRYDLAAVAQTDALDALFTPSVAPVAPPPTEAPARPAGEHAAVLAELNELCGDVWCEGERDYRFVALHCEGGQCRLDAEVRAYAATPDGVGPAENHTFDLGRVARVQDESGMPSEEFVEAVGRAINRFEGL